MEAFNRRDLGAFTDSMTSDVEWLPALEHGLDGGGYLGHRGVAAYFANLEATWEELRWDAEEYRDLGTRVLALGRIEGRGKTGGVPVDAPMGIVVDFRGSEISRARSFLDHDEALETAGLEPSRPVENVSANLDLVRSIVGPWERGDYSSVDWADPEIEYVHVAGPAPGSWVGINGMEEGWGEMLSVMTEHRVEAYEFRELDGDRVLVLFHLRGHGRTSGLDLGRMQAKVASLFHVDGGRVTRLVNYLDRDRALADLGLAE